MEKFCPKQLCLLLCHMLFVTILDCVVKPSAVVWIFFWQPRLHIPYFHLSLIFYSLWKLCYNLHFSTIGLQRINCSILNSAGKEEIRNNQRNLTVVILKGWLAHAELHVVTTWVFLAWQIVQMSFITLWLISGKLISYAWSSWWRRQKRETTRQDQHQAQTRNLRWESSNEAVQFGSHKGTWSHANVSSG